MTWTVFREWACLRKPHPNVNSLQNLHWMIYEPLEWLSFMCSLRVSLDELIPPPIDQGGVFDEVRVLRFSWDACEQVGELLSGWPCNWQIFGWFLIYTWSGADGMKGLTSLDCLLFLLLSSVGVWAWADCSTSLAFPYYAKNASISKCLCLHE